MNKFTPNEYFEKRDKADRFSQLVEEKRPPDRYMVAYRGKEYYYRDWRVETCLTLELAKQRVDYLTGYGEHNGLYEIIISEILDLKD